jgi:type IV secretory pathway VirB2 component (pilin)
MFSTSLLFGAAGDATTILKDTTNEQVSGDIGFMVIIIGIVLAGATMMFQKNIYIPAIIFLGSIVFAMSPDLADGVIQQFGTTSAP